jgi:ABC-type phosphate/phosphonate transport system substrate-binding protein
MSPPKIAALPMYDFPEIRGDTDALWERVAKSLRATGIDGVPTTLSRDRGHIETWRNPNLLLAQACEYPLAAGLAGALQLVATPVYDVDGCSGPLYRSAIVVWRYEPARILADMRGRHCVVNEPSSNSGMNLLRAAVAPLAGNRGGFFESVTVSGSHRRSLEMIADGEADLAAVDCVSWAHLQRIAPQLKEALRVLAWTDASPSLPLVTAGQTDAATLQALRLALAEAMNDPALDLARERLFLSGFDFSPDGSFARVRQLAARAAALRYPEIA